MWEQPRFKFAAVNKLFRQFRKSMLSCCYCFFKIFITMLR